MHHVPSVWVTALALLLATSCPKTPVATNPVETERNGGPQDRKLALILRAADRRIVDEDLRALLADGDVRVRATAVLALGQIGEPSCLTDLDKTATDSSIEPRANTAFAMGLIGDPSASATLERLAGDTAPKVRAAAAEALGRLHQAGSVVIVRSLLDDPDTSVRAAAALGTWKFAEPAMFLDGLIAHLGAADQGLRTAAAYALARLASASVAPASSGTPVGKLSSAEVARARAALAANVLDAEPEVRMQVARGLAAPQGAVELAVVGALSRDRDPGVRVNAVRALGYPGVSLKPYLHAALADKDQGVTRAALEAIGKVGGSSAVEELNRVVVKIESAWLREAALTALASVDPRRTPAIVDGLLMNPDPAMRGSAAALIAGRKEAGAIRAASALLADPQPRVQAVAVPIVADQDGPISRLLEGLFTAADPVVRAAVAEAVGGRFARLPSAVESRDDLLARLEEIWTASAADTIPDAKLAVVDAAAKAGKDERTQTTLSLALADPDVIVRRRAVARTRDVYGDDRSRDVGPAADRPLSDYEKIVSWTRTPHAALVTVQRPGTLPGRFTIALDASGAPMAAWNFAELAEKRFFDGATVHRVVPNFVVQDGDPRGDGYGGPGYSIRDEFNPHSFSAGVLGMASDGKDTAGSQWFVTLSAQPHLDGRYTSFGRVVRGLRSIVSQMLPGDTVVSIRIYEGSGAEPMPQD